jgi:membrane-associated protease RseP (regulator of RpoE activity)
MNYQAKWQKRVVALAYLLGASEVVGFSASQALSPRVAQAEDANDSRPVATQVKKQGGLGYLAAKNTKQDFEAFCKQNGVPMPPRVGDTVLVIRDFLPDSPAAAAGMKESDVLFKIQGVEIDGDEGLAKARAKVIVGEPAEVVVRRIKQAGKTRKWETVRLTIQPIEREAIDAAVDAREKSMPPVVMTASGIHYNVIAVPELTIEFQNTRSEAVEAFEVEIECFDKFDEAVTFPGKGNVFKGISQSTVEPKGKSRASWQLSLHRNTTKAKVWVSRVKIGDGTIWTQTRDEAEKADNIAPARLIE